ncbi:hypothetical protein LCGC14_2194230, partial [marine sediment metagenome]
GLWRGEARHGAARRGKARRGKARRGRGFRVSALPGRGGPTALVKKPGGAGFMEYL